MPRYFYSLLLTLLSLNAFAGSIKGTITDAKSAVPVMGVAVSLPGTGKGTISDIDGNYVLPDVADGSYEIEFTYPSYVTYKQTITVAGEATTLDVKLLPQASELKDHVVKSSKITFTEASVVNEIKQSNAVVSGISAAQIGKTMDRNAADVVKRVPGVTIQDDRFIVIRGLPDRYNTVWLNDASTPSSESDRRAFSFDIIPAGLIDRILIFKTPSAELPGDFAGGMVKVYTSSIPDKNQLTVGFQTSYRQNTTGTEFNYAPPSKTDWLGFDDGRRNIPSVIPAFISTKDPNYKTEIGNWSKSFGNDFLVNTTTTNPDLRFSLAASNVLKLKKLKIGNTLGIAYSNTYTNYMVERQDWVGPDKDYHYMDKRSSNNVNAGLMDNLGISIGNTKIEFKNLYSQIGNSLFTLRRTVPDSITNDPDEKAYLMQYESRATYNTQLTGTHKNDADTRKYTWTLGYTDFFRNLPNRRILKYSKDLADPDSAFVTSIPNQPDILNGGRFYSRLAENTYSFSHQFSQKIPINKRYSVEVTVGNYAEQKSRQFSIRQLGYAIRRTSKNAHLFFLPVNEIFADSNVDGNLKFKIGEQTNDYDKYEGDNKLLASHLSLKLPYKDRLTLVAGVRHEYNVQTITSYTNQDTIKPALKTTFLLPSVNAAYNISKNSLIRLAYGKTLNRPEFREAAYTFYYDFDELAGTKGALFPTNASRSKNPSIGDTLRVAEIQNFDVRYELYPGTGEMIQLGAFYKTFVNPIQRVLVPSSASGDSRTFTFVNADNAVCYGLELDVRKNLSLLDRLLHTEFFSDLSIVGNISLARSKFKIDTTAVNGAITDAPLQGQAPYIINAGLFYQSLENGFQGSILYNVSGARTYAIGTIDPGGESLGEMPFRSLDAALSKTFYKHYVLSFGVQNLLDARNVFMKDVNRDNKFDKTNDQDFRSFKPGRYYTIGLKIKF